MPTRDDDDVNEPPVADAPVAEVELTEAALARVPIFPLPRAMLFPGVVVPLHLFEPRYQAMAEYCVEAPGHRLLALATLAPGYEDDYEGRPPVVPIMGVGQIVAHQKLEDGRWNIAVRGLGRTRLMTELPPDESFRLGALELLPDVLHPMDAEGAARLVTMVLQLGARLPAVRPQLTQLIAEARVPGRVADVAAGVFVDGLPLQQRLLEEVSVERRLGIVTELVGRLLLTTPTPVDDDDDEPASGPVFN
ncbi:MAG: Lon protease-like protein [Myxococcota bacterium]|jgi:Lon protease-like protein